jgi:hypothetical protein
MKIKVYPLIICSVEPDTDILFLEYQKNTKVNLTVAEETVINRLEFMENKQHYLVLDISNVQQITHEAKVYLQNPKTGLKNILGAAFIAPNPLSVLFANIFIKTPKNFHAKFFSKKKDALNWIMELKNNG